MSRPKQITSPQELADFVFQQTVEPVVRALTPALAYRYNGHAHYLTNIFMEHTLSTGLPALLPPHAELSYQPVGNSPSMGVNISYTADYFNPLMILLSQTRLSAPLPISDQLDIIKEMGWMALINTPETAQTLSTALDLIGIQGQSTILGRSYQFELPDDANLRKFSTLLEIGRQLGPLARFR